MFTISPAMSRIAPRAECRCGEKKSEHRYDGNPSHRYSAVNVMMPLYPPRCCRALLARLPPIRTWIPPIPLPSSGKRVSW
jgi:hypothetical protein